MTNFNQSVLVYRDKDEIMCQFTLTIEAICNQQFSIWLYYLNKEIVTSVTSKIDTKCSLRDFVAIAIFCFESG